MYEVEHIFQFGGHCQSGTRMKKSRATGTLLGQRFRGVELVSANAVFSVLFGVGGLLGPFIVGTAMTAIGPAGFPVSLVVAVGLYGLFSVYRRAAHD